jgi:endogenous inhibitor of DNA gyrase (YacG/DUF329 family)
MVGGANRSDGKPESAEVVPLRPSRKCPICGKPSVRATHPFCSKRCADIDLNRWLSGSYAIAAVEEESSGAEDYDDGEN